MIALKDLRELLNRLPYGVGLFIYGGNGASEYLNDRYYQMTGYNEKEYAALSDDPIGNLVYPSDVQVRVTAEEMLRRDGHASARYRIVRKDGDTMWVGMEASRMKLKDRVYILCTFQDITKEKKTEANIQLLSDSVNSGISIIKLNGNDRYSLFANESFYKMLGVTRDEYIKDPEHYNRKALSKEDYSRVSEAVRKASADNGSYVEYWLTRTDGKRIYVRRDFTIINNNDEGTLLLSVTTDMTDLKHANDRLDEERDRYRLVLERAHATIIEWNYITGDFYASETYKDYAVSDVDSNDILHNKGPEDIVHPDDLSTLHAFFNSRLEPGSASDCILRLKMKDGSYRWSRMFGILSKDDEGTPLRAIGAIIDMDREMEDSLIVKGLVEAMPVAMGIYDIVDAHIRQLYLNNSFYIMIGGSRHDMTGYSEGDFLKSVYSDDIPVVEKAINDILSGESHIDVAYRLIDASGEYIWIRMIGNLHITTGKRQLIYCTFFNVDKETKVKLAMDTNQRVLRRAMATGKMYSWEYDVRKHVLYYDGSDYNLDSGTEAVLRDAPDSIIKFDVVHPGSIDAFRDLFRTMDPTDDPVVRDIYVKKPDQNNYRWDRIIMTPVFDKNNRHIQSIGLSIDITDQKTIEIKYRHQLQLMDSANSPDLIAKALYDISTGTREIYHGFNKDAVSSSHVTTYNNGMLATASHFVDKNAAAEFKAKFARDELLRQFSIGNTQYAYTYRRYTHDRDIIWASTEYILFIEPESNDLMCFIYSYNIDEKKTSQDMIDAVIWLDYDYIGLLDCLKNRLTMHFKLKSDSGSSNIPVYVYEDYESDIERYLRKNVIPEEVEPAVKSMRISNIRKQLRTGRSFIYYVPLLRADGHIDMKKMEFSYLDEFSEKIVITRLDVTDMYKREQDRVKALNKANLAVVEANNTKTEFLSRMSHDLRTPMNAIIGLSELARTGKFDASTMAEYIEDINSTGKFMLGLVNDCLDTEKLAAGKMRLNPEVYTYKRFRSTLMTMISPLCREKNIKLEFVDIPDQSNIYVDPVRLEQIFINLLTNAVKFTPEGGTVKFVVNTHTDSNGMLHGDFIVSDNGIGMSRKFQEKMFEPFEQEESSNTTPSQGTGLGLSIVKSLVDLMGGTIEVESSKGHGSAFTVHLDIRTANGSDEENTEHTDKDNGFPLTGRKILLVEDNPLNAKIAVNLLENQEMKVFCASNGRECLDMFSDSASGFYDAVLMDIRMPEMNGLEATKAICCLDRADSADIPIIAMTANAFDEDIRATKDAGMNEHLAKPIQTDKLYNALKYWISEYRN